LIKTAFNTELTLAVIKGKKLKNNMPLMLWLRSLSIQKVTHKAVDLGKLLSIEEFF